MPADSASSEPCQIVTPRRARHIGWVERYHITQISRWEVNGTEGKPLHSWNLANGKNLHTNGQATDHPRRQRSAANDMLFHPTVCKARLEQDGVFSITQTALTISVAGWSAHSESSGLPYCANTPSTMHNKYTNDDVDFDDCVVHIIR